MKKELEAEFFKQHTGMLKETINIWQITIKNTESSFSEFLDANNLYGWAMSQKLPADDFKCVEEGNYQHLMRDS